MNWKLQSHSFTDLHETFLMQGMGQTEPVVALVR